MAVSMLGALPAATDVCCLDQQVEILCCWVSGVPDDCRFVCRKRLGGRKGDPAAYLTPVPPNAVVYGTGDAARIITKVIEVERYQSSHTLYAAGHEAYKTALCLNVAH